MTSRPRVLFVDDEPRVLEGLRRALRAHQTSWDMVFVNRPAEALAQFQERPFDVVVSDLAMPGMTGLDMILKMKSSANACAFIMLTGTADLPQAVAAINQAQVFRFFTKPCATGLLVEGITTALAEATERKTTPDSGPAAQTKGSLSASIGLAALNRVAFGVLVVDRHARVLLANRSGGEILSERDGLVLSNGEILRAATPQATEQLHALVLKAVVTDDEDEDTSGMAIERPSGKRPLSVLLCSVPEAHTEEHGPLAVLFVSDPDRQPLPAPEAIEKLFDLTPSESRLVHALTEGLRLDEAATRCGLTLSTARTYLKQIFGKTGTRRQPELVKLVLTSPALAN